MDRGLDVFNTLPGDAARPQLLSCCAAPGWARAVLAGRPYPDRAALADAALAQVRALPWAEVVTAVAGHPRIGQPPAGDGREAGWSRREQAAATATATATGDSAQPAQQSARAALGTLNEAYEQRFGFRFLVFANGRNAAELAAVAQQRLGNDDDTERAVVRTELGRIAALRIGRLVDDLAGPDEAGWAPLSTHVLDTASGTPAAGVPVRLARADLGGQWRTIALGRTDDDGRLRDWAPAAQWGTGTYRLVFDVSGRLGPDAFYTEIPVVFTVRDAGRHHHVPLLLSPYGYTTYRGS
ncbi:2-oxo-4-hydroxy-4-carboxy-5-ureidoimidazoline decarboxylase [Solwaraspora sp. WMMB335]|uniref:2-oxo-4-hydroxy-4-carboxy-5-ureidoimidazoline decarboxylase n=1 Tax=Solwaraspora sp. WMMB335 TaxID=3404118 RepID=UPI003B92948D